MNVSTLQKISAISLVTMPLFACYNLMGTSMPKYLMLFTSIILCVGGHFKYYLPKRLKYFLLYAFTLPQIMALITGNTSQFFGSYITVIIFVANLCLALPYINIDKLQKYYRIVVYFCLIVFFLQELSALFTGQRFSALIPFFTLYTGIPVSQFAPSLAYAGRSSSVFVEPSHFAQYLALFLALSLYCSFKKKRIFSIESIIVSLVFLLMRSGNGLLLCAIIWVMHILLSNVSRLKKFFIIFPLSILCVSYIFTAYSNTENGSQILNRVEELSSDQTRYDSSGMIRIFRGFFVQSNMSLETKILGVGQGGANDIIDRSPVRWMFFNEHYLNNASAFLISYGYIGSFLFLFFLFSMISKTDLDGSMMVLMAFLLLCFIESFIFDSRMLLYLVVFCSFYYRKKNEKGVFS